MRADPQGLNSEFCLLLFKPVSSVQYKLNMTKFICPATQSLVVAWAASASIVHGLVIRIACFVLAVVATLIFYLPALKRDAVDAGALAKIDTLINSLILQR